VDLFKKWKAEQGPKKKERIIPASATARITELASKDNFGVDSAPSYRQNARLIYG
jgi:hypothetical protein